MRRYILGMVLAGALMAASLASAIAAPMMVKFHPVTASHAMMMMTMHTTGSATITYTKHDADIKVTAGNLPAVASVHGKFYVVWAITGTKMNTYAGVLTVHGAMAAGHYMVMDTMFTQLVVTAEKSMHPMHSMGARVLTATVMHH
jgi:hypothetical protein